MLSGNLGTFVLEVGNIPWNEKRSDVLFKYRYECMGMISQTKKVQGRHLT